MSVEGSSPGIISSTATASMANTATPPNQRTRRLPPIFSAISGLAIGSSQACTIFLVLRPTLSDGVAVGEGDAVAQLMDELQGQGAFTLSQGALQRLRMEFDSGDCSEDETSAAIATLYRMTGEVVCPHTAVGIKVAADKRISGRVPMITLATAHPAKFPDAVEAACGLRPGLPARMADLFERPERLTHVANDLAAIKDIILQRTAHER